MKWKDKETQLDCLGAKQSHRVLVSVYVQMCVNCYVLKNMIVVKVKIIQRTRHGFEDTFKTIVHSFSGLERLKRRSFGGSGSGRSVDVRN